MATTAPTDSIRPDTDAVTAPLTFMVKTGDKPYVDTEALTGEANPQYHAETEQRDVRIHDAHPRAVSLSLDRNGIAFRRQPTLARDLYDDAQVEQVYYAEIRALVAAATGASRVVIFDHTRRRDDGSGDGRAKRPASRVHNDYTEWSGAQRVRDVLGEQEARRLGDTPFAQFNVWRPITGPVRRSPLALLDAASLDPDDLIGTDMRYPDRTGEIYHLAWNPNQHWLYFPTMTPEQAILIKGYDSRTDGRARFAPHGAFDDPTTRPDDRPRESIEVRTLALFE